MASHVAQRLHTYPHSTSTKVRHSSSSCSLIYVASYSALLEMGLEQAPSAIVIMALLTNEHLEQLSHLAQVESTGNAVASTDVHTVWRIYNKVQLHNKELFPTPDRFNRQLLYQLLGTTERDLSGDQMDRLISTYKWMKDCPANFVEIIESNLLMSIYKFYTCIVKNSNDLEAPAKIAILSMLKRSSVNHNTWPDDCTRNNLTYMILHHTQLSELIDWVEESDAEFRDIWLDPSTTSNSIKGLYRSASRHNVFTLEFTVDDIRIFLSHQSTYKRHLGLNLQYKQQKHTVVHRPMVKWQMDLADMQNSAEYNDGTLRKTIARALDYIFKIKINNKAYKPMILLSDNGKEFIAKEVKQLSIFQYTEHRGILMP
ncbi:hypothetical protein PROFUN_00763 [Planoprotostelium fungivorum]|uniref:Integrase catalytic domain-containing protein n=1 Tax=Planoprotostelium fungivorum TaxID=1890364 RepID=A0A2P6NUA9_9EUKA|nr:hypothetical protein PROFUN_00763 [Planoprotostelium fungivorum]